MAQFKVVSVTYSNGQVIPTTINPDVTDEDIKQYFAPGRSFNIGSGPSDNMQKVVSCELEGIKEY